jgi:hypothetical protein
VPGYPIRTPSDHSSVDNSPRTIAASHVLHRPLMPRHPPCALNNLTTTRCSHPLSNTQHTTTPQPTTTTTTPNQPPPTTRGTQHPPRGTTADALDGPGQEQPEKTTPTSKVSSQDPTVCQAVMRPTPRSEDRERLQVFHPEPPSPHPPLKERTRQPAVNHERTTIHIPDTRPGSNS